MHSSKKRKITREMIRTLGTLIITSPLGESLENFLDLARPLELAVHNTLPKGCGLRGKPWIWLSTTRGQLIINLTCLKGWVRVTLSTCCVENLQ